MSRKAIYRFKVIDQALVIDQEPDAWSRNAADAVRICMEWISLGRGE